MLYNFLSPYTKQAGFLNLFHYITFRAGCACLTALIISLFLGPPVIRMLKRIQGEGQPIRDVGPQRHILEKAGTPTMGGILILTALTLSTLLWADLKNGFIWTVLLTTLGFGLVGFFDDYKKLKKKNSAGLSKTTRLGCEFIISFIATIFLESFSPNFLQNSLTFPFIKELILHLGWLYPLFATIFITGFGNAVNLTDGLDGLATVPIIIAATVFAFIAYIVGNSIFSDYLQIHTVPGTGELTVFCAALIGSCLGFLWFNAQPAELFMGDTGSLALGSAISVTAVAIKHEFVLCIVGGLFIVETLSVIIQVTWYKRTKKRIFLMAPLHHHFEKIGWQEPKIVIRFWIIALILGLCGLATLKLR